MSDFRQLVKRGLLKFGYRLERLPATNMGRFHPDVQAALTVKDRQFYTRWSKPYPLFSAWLGDPEFRRHYEGIEAYTVVSPDRCYMLYTLARYDSRLDGDFAECGVYRGGTALLLSRILTSAAAKKNLLLFDSFQGLPDASAITKEGNFRVPPPKAWQACCRDSKALKSSKAGFRTRSRVLRAAVSLSFTWTSIFTSRP
jgi:Macrocin-O-methyltransferase (TylF)